MQSDEKTLVLDNDHNSQSDEEEEGGFLMIKPISTGISNPKFHQPTKTQNFNLRKKNFLDHFVLTINRLRGSFIP